MTKGHQIGSRKGNAALRRFLAKEGAALVPMVELIEAGQVAVEELVDSRPAMRWRLAPSCRALAITA